jgi:hypothetical protein
LDGGGGGGGGSQKAQNNQKKQRGLLTKTLQQHQKLGPKVEVVLKIKLLIIADYQFQLLRIIRCISSSMPLAVAFGILYQMPVET